jgi:hypothetical protein
MTGLHEQFVLLRNLTSRIGNLSTVDHQLFFWNDDASGWFKRCGFLRATPKIK